MARRPAGRKRVGPTRKQGKLTMRAAKGSKRKTGKAVKSKRIVRRAASRSKGSTGYTPPRVSMQPPAKASGPFNRAGINPGGAMMRGFLAAKRR